MYRDRIAAAAPSVEGEGSNDDPATDSGVRSWVQGFGVPEPGVQPRKAEVRLWCRCTLAAWA